MVNLDLTVRSEDQEKQAERMSSLMTIVIMAYGLSVFLLGLLAGAAMVWIFRGCTLPAGW